MDRRQRRHEDHQNHEAWAIPYADLLTLLLAFFVVMYAISSVNEGKYRQLSDALNLAFNGSQGSPMPLHMDDRGPVATRAAAGDAAVQSGLAMPLAGMAKPSQGTSQDDVPDAKEAGRAKQLQDVAESVEQAMSGLIQDGLVVVRRKEDVVEALREMIAHDGPYVLEVLVPYQEHVLPMIPAGGTVRDIIKS